MPVRYCLTFILLLSCLSLNSMAKDYCGRLNTGELTDEQKCENELIKIFGDLDDRKLVNFLGHQVMLTSHRVGWAYLKNLEETNQDGLIKRKNGVTSPEDFFEARIAAMLKDEEKNIKKYSAILTSEQYKSLQTKFENAAKFKKNKNTGIYNPNSPVKAGEVIDSSRSELAKLGPIIRRITLKKYKDPSDQLYQLNSSDLAMLNILSDKEGFIGHGQNKTKESGYINIARMINSSFRGSDGRIGEDGKFINGANLTSANINDNLKIVGNKIKEQELLLKQSLEELLGNQGVPKGCEESQLFGCGSDKIAKGLLSDFMLQSKNISSFLEEEVICRKKNNEFSKLLNARLHYCKVMLSTSGGCIDGKLVDPTCRDENCPPIKCDDPKEPKLCEPTDLLYQNPLVTDKADCVCKLTNKKPVDGKCSDEPVELCEPTTEQTATGLIQDPNDTKQCICKDPNDALVGGLCIKPNPPEDTCQNQPGLIPHPTKAKVCICPPDSSLNAGKVPGSKGCFAPNDPRSDIIENNTNNNIITIIDQRTINYNVPTTVNPQPLILVIQGQNGPQVIFYPPRFQPTPGKIEDGPSYPNYPPYGPVIWQPGGTFPGGTVPGGNTPGGNTPTKPSKPVKHVPTGTYSISLANLQGAMDPTEISRDGGDTVTASVKQGKEKHEGGVCISWTINKIDSDLSRVSFDNSGMYISPPKNLPYFAGVHSYKVTATLYPCNGDKVEIDSDTIVIERPTKYGFSCSNPVNSSRSFCIKHRANLVSPLNQILPPMDLFQPTFGRQSIYRMQ